MFGVVHRFRPILFPFPFSDKPLLKSNILSETILVVRSSDEPAALDGPAHGVLEAFAGALDPVSWTPGLLISRIFSQRFECADLHAASMI
ncbi:MAG: hypothetical protein KGJ60_05690, partial [Verrucomicrobiota bacterium]|nr:hypothetical protein [Verrucomicrobiota bacterium]